MIILCIDLKGNTCRLGTMFELPLEQYKQYIKYFEKCWIEIK